MQLFANNADSSLNGAIAPDTTVLVLKAGEGSKFPSPANGDFFLVTLFERLGTTELNHEIVKCTSRAGDSLTVVRAQEGTTARAFSTGDFVELRVTAKTLADKEPAIPADSLSNYFAGDKSWRDFFTDVRAATLTGISTVTNAVVTATDTVLVAIGKLQAQVSNKVDKVAGKGLSTEDYTTVEKTKLGSVASGATANDSDANLKSRANHTGTQAIETVVGLQSALDEKAPTASPAFTNTATFQGVKETVTPANTGTAYTVANTAASILDLTLTGNCVLTYPAPSGGGQFTLFLKQDATGTRTVTWPSTVRWAGGTAPTLTATANRTDVVTFLSDGTYWLGFVGGLNFTRA